MIWLFLVSFIWAFSFGLIKGHLTGLDPLFVAFVRMAVAFLIFLPFLRIRKLPMARAGLFCLLGAVQFGLMYVTYLYAYQYLQAHQVALYTIFTPIYVTLIAGLLSRRLRVLFLFTSLLAVAGAYIILEGTLSHHDLRFGFLLIQCSNLAFAVGQVFYKRLLRGEPKSRDREIFGLLYFGAVLVTGIASAFTTDYSAIQLTWNQVLVLAYLGILASGLCFYLWNYGAARTGTGTLAVFNNLKVPLAVACSLLFFHEQGDPGRLLCGGGIIVGALFLNEYAVFRRVRK